jgi:hypothetical protein
MQWPPEIRPNPARTLSGKNCAWMVVGLCCAVFFGGCKPFQVNNLRDRIRPSNQRDWEPDQAKLAHAEIADGIVNLHNVRNCQYVTADDYIVNYRDQTFRLDEIESVDFVMVPFNETPLLAHTMLSFGLKDDSRLAVSIEIRKEKQEKFSPVLGALRQYELAYVIADEKDLIRLRTRFRDSDVYIYPTVAKREQAQQLFVNVMNRANDLAVKPEFYNSFTNNCTTNLSGHVNQVASNKITYGWRVLLPGFSAQYAYDLGLLPNDVPFEDLTALAYVNDLAEEYFDDPQFSSRIRARRSLVDRLVQRQSQRAPIMAGSGDEHLADRENERRLWR